MVASTEPTWVSKEQAALTRGCSTRTIDRYIHDGLLATRKVGAKSVEVNLEDLDRTRRAESIDPALRGHVRALVEAWPKLTPAQVDRVAILLRGEAA